MVNMFAIKGEAFTSIHADLVNEKWFYKPNSKGLGKFVPSNQELWFLKVLINFLYATLSGGTRLQSVMSQPYNCLMELYTNSTIFYFSWKSLYFYT